MRTRLLMVVVLISFVIPTNSMLIDQNPKQVLQNFITLFNKRDMSALVRLVVKGNNAITFQRALEDEKHLPALEMKDCRISIKGNNAKALLRIKIVLDKIEETLPYEQIKLIKNRGRWMILPPNKREASKLIDPHPTNPFPIISRITALIAYPDLLKKSEEQAMDIMCQLRLRQLLMIVILYAQDHDDRLPDYNNWKDAISSYITNKSVFKCPIGAEYVLNPQVAGKTISSIDKSTIIFFEGKFEKGLSLPSYMHKNHSLMIRYDNKIERVLLPK